MIYLYLLLVCYKNINTKIWNIEVQKYWQMIIPLKVKILVLETYKYSTKLKKFQEKKSIINNKIIFL